MGFGVWGLRFGVWGLRFGVWGLGFGVWGLSGIAFRVYRVYRGNRVYRVYRVYRGLQRFSFIGFENAEDIHFSILSSSSTHSRSSGRCRTPPPFVRHLEVSESRVPYWGPSYKGILLVGDYIRGPLLAQPPHVCQRGAAYFDLSRRIVPLGKTAYPSQAILLKKES